MIVQNVKGYIYIGSDRYLYQNQYTCGGTVVNENTVLSAGHCIQTKFDYYGYTVYTSSFYPTLESMFDIYIGAHDISSSYAPNKIKLSVKRVIKV